MNMVRSETVRATDMPLRRKGKEMAGKKTEFLYLSEPDMIKAGVLDVKRCVDVAEETFALLSEGDSHGRQ